MGDEFSNTGSGNWWGTSSRNRFDQSAAVLPSSSSSSSCSSSGLSCGALGSFGWPETETVELKERSTSMESGGSVVFHDKLHDSSASTHHQHNLQMMGLGLSSQPIDQWNQSLLRSDKAETSFRVMLGDKTDASASSYQQEPANMGSSPSSSSQPLWRDSSVNEFKQQISNRGFFLDQSQFSPHGSSSDSTVTCQGLPSNTNFQIDNSSNSLYGGSSSSGIFQGYLGTDQPQNQPQQSALSYNQYGVAAGSYGLSSNSDQMAVPPSAWPRQVPQTFLRTSPPKPHSPLRFSNNATFWNPSAAANVSSHDAPSNFFPTLQTQQIHTPSFDEKPKNISEIRDPSSTAKRSASDQPAAKRTKSETASPSPTFKVRKEKMGDRIAALQQLVSPFGKTDAASVLSEAIEYIKFLHDQVTALSNPYLKSGASLPHQQNSDQSKNSEAPKQDLRSRGLCLVPVSSTFPVTHETTVEFWMPTFGGTFR